MKPVEQRNAIREQYGIKADEFVVIGVGQVQTRKGVLDFVDVAKKLPDVRFVWCGGFSFGKITDGYEELKKVVENPPANVQFPGIIPRSDMNDIYNMADVLFMPSYNELFPMAILEAVNLHRPMVLRSLKLYEDILFKKYQMADDNDSFAELIRKLHEDPAYYARCAADSAYISEYYSKENVLSIWKEFYTRVYEELQERKRG